MSTDVLVPPAANPSANASETDSESPASAPPTSTSFTFPQSTSPPPVPPKPAAMSLTVAPPSHPHTHARSQSTSTGAAPAFLRLGSGSGRRKGPMSMYAAEGNPAPASSTDLSDGKPRPEPAAKPSWLKRTTSGSKAIASSMGLTGAGASGKSAPAPALPPRDRARAGSAPGREERTTPPDTTPPERSPVSTSDSRFAPLPPPPQRSNPPILPSRGHSEDAPRSSTPNITLGPRGAGIASRINAWTSEAASSSAGRNATGLLKAAPGAIGSAVQSGWGQFRGGRSVSGLNGGGVTSGSTSSSGLSSLSSFAKSSLPSSTSHLDAGDGLNERDGPHLTPQSVRRPRRIGRRNCVFGVEPVAAAAEFPADREGVAFPTPTSARADKRKASLPAIALRCVDYLEIWAPKEEGIFRISGRSTHVNVLRKAFDEGADLELVNCDPGDIDPHAIASMYKAYLRELPIPILTAALSAQFDEVMNRHLNSRATERDFGAGGMGGMASLHVGQAGGAAGAATDGTGLISELRSLLDQLPPAHWWMLSDLALLLDHTSKHSSENKMTLGNLLMVLCPSVSLTPTFLRQLVDHHAELFTLEPVPEAPKSDGPLPPIDHLAPPVAAKDTPKFSTPIADRFARTGPIELSLRD